MHNKKLSRNIIALFLVQLANYAAPILVLPYLTRVLGVEYFGYIAVLLSLCALSFVLTDFGFGLTATYRISKSKNNISLIQNILSSIISLKLLLFILSCFFLLLYFYLNKNVLDTFNVKLYVCLIILGQCFQFSWFFQGLERMHNITIFMVASKVVYVILVILLVKNNTDYEFVLLSYGISSLFASFISIFLIFKSGFRFNVVKFKVIKNEFLLGLNFFLSRLSVSVYTSASTFLIGNFSGLNQAALYSSAERLYQAGQSLLSPVTQALYPHVAQNKNFKLFFYIFFLILIPLIALAFILTIFSSEILSIFFGDEFSSAAGIYDIFIIVMLINFVGVYFGYPAFALLDRINIANSTVYVGAITQLFLLTFLFIDNEITAENIAISVLITESFVATIRITLFIYFYTRTKRNASQTVS